MPQAAWERRASAEEKAAMAAEADTAAEAAVYVLPVLQVRVPPAGAVMAETEEPEETEQEADMAAL